MSEYMRHTWVDGEEISAERLNNLEQGITEAKKAAEAPGTELKNHNESSESHQDIRKALGDIAEQINTLLNTDDATLAEMQELIDYINSNKDLLEELATGKVNVTDIVDNLVTNVANKPLSAAQGVVLKGLIDALTTTVDGKASKGELTAHNTSVEAHADLRAELQALTNRINAALNSDDTTLDELSEIVAYIKSNKALIDAITTSKVSVADIVDNLVTNVANKPLSAAQGVVLKGLIDAITTTLNGKAPTNHAASSTTYGAGSGSAYGHVKLSDATNGTSNENGGMAATPAAIKALADLIAKCLPIIGGELTGELIVNENFQVRKSFDDIPYRSYLRPANYALGDEYTTALIHYVNGVNSAQLIFNRSGVLLRDNVDGKASQIYGQHNIGSLRSESLNRTTKVNAHDTNYTTLMARGTSLNSADTNPTANGTIAWTYK